MSKPTYWTITTDNGNTQDEREFDDLTEARAAWSGECAEVASGRLHSVGWKAYNDQGEVLNAQSYDAEDAKDFTKDFLTDDIC